jgi:hypothetical protein
MILNCILLIILGSFLMGAIYVGLRFLNGAYDFNDDDDHYYDVY